jgi:hypothetical protein
MPLNCSYGFASFGATQNLPARISVVPSTTATTEGGLVNFTVITQNLPSPLTYYWTVSGLRGTVDSTDFSTDSWGTYDDLNNTAVSGNIALAKGHQTGTNKTFYYSIRAVSTTSRILSTSTAITIISPLYTSVTVDNNLMYEGEGTSTFTVNTSGCVDGTVLYYTARATVGSISGSSFASQQEVSQIFTTPGANTWTCPAGVYSINVVCVGGGGGAANYYGGGGGGGALAWKNNIAVVPGTVYTMDVGFGGAKAVSLGYPTEGGSSSFTAGFGTIIANGGRGAYSGAYGNSSLGGPGGTPSGIYDGGGNGGAGGTNSGTGPTIASGGGGAGGYSGNGGDGIGTLFNNTIVPATAGSGGGGGGGSSLILGNIISDLSAGGGGGVGLFGQGSNGAAGIQGSTTSRGGFGGSGGGNGVSVTSTSVGGDGGTYGGGGASNGGSGSSPGQGNNSIVGNGSPGAIRISWAVPNVASIYGSFTVNNNVGTLVFVSAAEDGNNTDDTYVVDIRTDSTSGPVVKTSPPVKMVDLTTYKASYTTYTNELTNKFGGKAVAVTLYGGGGGLTTTATFLGSVLNANFGGNATTSAVGAGGTASGGDVNATGGVGIQNGIASGLGQSGGSGGSAGGNSASGAWATSWPDGLNSNGLFTALSALGYVTVSTSYTPPTVQDILKGGRGGNNTQNITAESGFQGKIGGGGGGGGTSNGPGAGGGNVGGAPGAVFQYTTNGTVTGRVIRTSGVGWNYGFLETIPNGVDNLKVWIIGGGGLGSSGNGTTKIGGKGGGGGAISSKTWTWTTPTAPTKPTLA